MLVSILITTKWLCVVYFDQRLGAAHTKRWLKKSFSAYLMQKSFKNAKKSVNLSCLGIKHSTMVLVQTSKNLFFEEFCCKFLAFLAFAIKMLKMSISTSVFFGEILVKIYNNCEWSNVWVLARLSSFTWVFLVEVHFLFCLVFSLSLHRRTNPITVWLVFS